MWWENYDGWRFGHFLTDEGVPPQRRYNGKPLASKFLRPIRLLDFFIFPFNSFTFFNFSRQALSFEFIFCIKVQHHD